MKERYKYYPQMEYYDSLDSIPSPYLMFKSKSNYRSDIVNTDSKGFRFSGEDGRLRTDNLDQTGSINILTGGSAAFGVGATSDKFTIPAFLSKETGSRWVNFSGRAYTSTQEFISFAYYRDLHSSIENIVIFSGFNDIYLYFVSKYFNRQMGTFFSANDWVEKMNSNFRYRSLISRPFINQILRLMYGPLDFQLISDREVYNLLFRKVSISKVKANLSIHYPTSQYSENPTEVIDILRRNISNWKIMADSYNAKITFFLQPFSNWLPNKSLTDNEKNVFDILDNIGGEGWKTSSESLNSLHSWYSEELSKICFEHNINYFDSNNILDKDFNEDIFVDRVHITDYCNKILSEFIVKMI